MADGVLRTVPMQRPGETAALAARAVKLEFQVRLGLGALCHRLGLDSPMEWIRSEYYVASLKLTSISPAVTTFFFLAVRACPAMCLLGISFVARIKAWKEQRQYFLCNRTNMSRSGNLAWHNPAIIHGLSTDRIGEAGTSGLQTDMQTPLF